MAELALQLPVFIASPSDVREERDRVEEEIRNLAAEAADDGLLIRPIRWELDSTPTMRERPQQAINELLKKAELVVVIFWSSLGTESAPGAEDSGTLEELFRATEQVMRGSTDDIFVYFRNAPAPDAAAAAGYERVQSFRKKLQDARQGFLWSYETPDDLQQSVRKHLQTWLDRWRVLPDVCVNTLATSAPGPSMPEIYGENRLSQIRRFFRIDKEKTLTSELGAAAVDMYQTYGPQGLQQPLNFSAATGQTVQKYIGDGEDLSRLQLMRLLGRIEVSPAPLRKENGALYFADEEWFTFFCAAGLLDAIKRDRVEAVEHHAYINPVHQYLAALALPEKQQVVSTLIRWLLNTDMVTHARPVARNFAAFVLGMLYAEEAQDALIEAAEHDPGTDVRLYSVVSLGRMRSRRHLARLVALWRRELHAELRDVIGQAICRIVGIGNYPF